MTKKYQLTVGFVGVSELFCVCLCFIMYGFVLLLLLQVVSNHVIDDSFVIKSFIIIY